MQGYIQVHCVLRWEQAVCDGHGLGESLELGFCVLRWEQIVFENWAVTSEASPWAMISCWLISSLDHCVELGL